MRVVVRCIIIRNDCIVLCNHLERGFYFLPGGGLEEGERINDCIYRELAEEMGLAKDQILINSDERAIENIFKVGDENCHGINILKQVYVNADKIQSIESHIAFEEIKISDLPAIDLKPAHIKQYIIDLIK